MKAKLSCVWAFVCLLSGTIFLPAPAHANPKYAAYVMHADSGDVLFDKYSTAKRHPASLTKMMTLYVLFEALERGDVTLETELKVSGRAASQPPSKLGVKSGGTITVEKAIEALVIKSANDVAVVVAEHFSGTEWRFAQLMTAKARSLGMRATHFRNASGLPNSKQVTTARDMATLGQRVMQDFPQYFHYFNAKSFSYNGRTYSTHNRLVKDYDGADGIKTGYTRHSGFNLVTSATRDGQNLIGVVLGGRKSWTRDKHMRDILDRSFAAIQSNPLKIAALHREKPAPRIKPTLFAARANEAPTIAGHLGLQQELTVAATDLGEQRRLAESLLGVDDLGALIARADTDDFHEIERARIAAVIDADGNVGEGDHGAADEFTFSVQIGAYSSKALARDELERAARLAELTERDRVILPAEAGGAPLYRARFRKLSEIEAQLACEALRDSGLACFVAPAEAR